ncbi:MAG: hypothetical protein WD114_06620 [Phycisphaerales bacterium]
MSRGGPSRKPTMRIVRNLARSGGTLIGRCIGCMEGVTLISEIHPADLKTTNPMMQAKDWFSLVGPKDIAQWKRRPPSVLQLVGICDTRAQARGEKLVLRDWSHLDYIGVPFTTPAHGFALGDALEPAYTLRVSVTTRHPIDQYLSLTQLDAVAAKLGFDQYCLGCVRFAQYAAKHGFHRYEDFTADPDTVLRAMCEELDLPFDASYRDKWASYTTITGDTTPTLGRGAGRKEIIPMPRKPVDDALVERFRANADYRQACELLGYEA